MRRAAQSAAIAILLPWAGPTAGASSASLAGLAPRWQLNYTEDFSRDAAVGSFGDVYGETWRGYYYSHDTSGHGLYDPDHVLSAHDGRLDMHLRTIDGQPSVAAPIVPIPAADAKYGRFSVRFRADPVHRYKTAWLLWPTSGEWEEGEIDFPEGDLDGTISGFVHEVGRHPERNVLAVGTDTTYRSWHVATTEWTPTTVSFLLDGEVIGSTDDPTGIPHVRHYWVLQTETALEGPKPKPAASGHVYVDWVKAYEYMGQRGAPYRG